MTDVMTPSDHTQQQLRLFYSRIADIELAYRGHVSLGYCAIQRDGAWYVYSARIRLDHTATPERRVFQGPNIRAGVHPLNADRGFRGLIDELLRSQRIEIEGTVLLLDADTGGSLSAYLVPYPRPHEERKGLATLKLRAGRSWDMLDRDQLAWSLKGAEMPFESLAELCAAFDAGDESGGVEVSAAAAVRLLPASEVRNQRASLLISCATGLETKSCRLSYRVLFGSDVIVRASVAGDQLEWKAADGDMLAEHVISVPDGALVDCAVSYADATQDQAWAVDRTSIQNPRRAAFEPCDMGLTETTALLTSGGDRDGRAFEAAVSWILWMLGFNPVHLVSSKRVEDAPDIILECEGRFAIVECTTGQLKSDKRAHLNARSLAIRDSLAVAVRHGVDLFPILVTRLTREQVAPDLEEAARAGLHVLTRDELLPLFERTRLTNDPRAILEEWKQDLAGRQQTARRGGRSDGDS